MTSANQPRWRPTYFNSLTHHTPLAPAHLLDMLQQFNFGSTNASAARPDGGAAGSDAHMENANRTLGRAAALVGGPGQF